MSANGWGGLGGLLSDSGKDSEKKSRIQQQMDGVKSSFASLDTSVWGRTALTAELKIDKKPTLHSSHAAEGASKQPGELLQ